MASRPRLVLILLLALNSISSGGGSSISGGSSWYDVLGIKSTATQREIRAAYRAAALQWHPDKNVGNEKEAERRFIEISEAFTVLRDESARKQYDRSGRRSSSASSRRASAFDFNQASKLFKESFGETLWKNWHPGQEITGVLQRNGKRVSITIHPDGSSEEEEVDTAEGGSYTYVKSGGSGGTSVSFSIEGGLGNLLSEMVMPLRFLDGLPGGAFIAWGLRWGLSWVPTVLLLMCCTRCLGFARD